MQRGAGGAAERTLCLVGAIDAASQGRYRTDAERLIAEAGTGRLAIDLAAVTAMDSSGLGMLVHVGTVAREHSVEVVLRNVPPRPRALLRRTGLDRVFAIDGGSGP